MGIFLFSPSPSLLHSHYWPVKNNSSSHKPESLGAKERNILPISRDTNKKTKPPALSHTQIPRCPEWKKAADTRPYLYYPALLMLEFRCHRKRRNSPPLPPSIPRRNVIGKRRGGRRGVSSIVFLSISTPSLLSSRSFSHWHLYTVASPSCTRKNKKKPPVERDGGREGGTENSGGVGGSKGLI